jgi:CRISPR-associated protein Csm3
MKKVDQFRFSGTFKLLRNARTGGDDSSLQIGAADLLCLRDPNNGAPYFPGSSIKGKMRSSLEKVHGNFSGQNNNLPSTTGIISVVFSPHGNDKHSGPTRIRVHDASVVGPYDFGTKGSTAIDRQSGTALRGSLRTDEFVGPGAVFQIRIDLDIYDIDAAAEYETADGRAVRGYEALIAVVDHGLDELANTGIGAGTSKGYGQIELGEITIERVKRQTRSKFSDSKA